METQGRISMIIKYDPKDGLAGKSTRVGDLYFRVKILGEKVPTDISAGIQASKEIFDVKKKEFKRQAIGALENNVRLKDMETSVLKKILAGEIVRRRAVVPVAALTDVTFQYIVTEYKRRAESGLLRVKKTGLPLAKTSIETITSVMNIAIESGVDFNFSKHNAVTGHESIDECNNFIQRFIATMSTLDPATQSHRCVKVKQAITTICKVRGIHIGDLLDNLKVYAPEKPVVVIDREQVRYLLNNYRGIAEGCDRLELAAFQYFVVGLMLIARREDMHLWREANLHLVDGSMWLRYKQSKSQNTSAKWLDVPVPDLALEIFTENIKKFGKLMPPKFCRINYKLRDVAKRLPIFERMVQEVTGSTITMVPQWQTLIIHMGRASGASDKLSNSIDMAYVKEWGGWSPNSKAVERYVVMQKENMKGMDDRYQQTIKSA